jgi:O-acetyl-ADP-ribose deacetylase
MSTAMEQPWRSAIVLSKGDLTEAAVDAIVNAANNDLVLGGGVAGAIRAKGGPLIQAECDKLGPIPIGEAAITGSGKLKAHYVIHAASMRLGGRTSEAALRDSTRNSLRRAAERGLKSVAFPAIGTGIAGFPIERCAVVMLEEIRDHLRGATTPPGQFAPVERVEIVLFDEQGLGVFKDALAKMVD